MPRAATLQRLLSPALRDRPLLDSLERRFDPYFAERPQATGALRFELETALPFNQLSRVDKLMMAHSVEARVPFLDHRFAEMAMAIPFCLKVSGSTHKRALREAMADRLPQDVVHRPKSGKRGTQALLPTLLAMVTRGALAHLISHEALGARGWFDPDAVSAYLRDADTLFVRFHPIERRRRAKFALALAVLEQWARLFLDRETVNVDV
jgi:asparagine synthase (glutamine-hydrolysing)